MEELLYLDCFSTSLVCLIKKQPSEQLNGQHIDLHTIFNDEHIIC